MASKETMPLVRKVAVKQQDGSLGNDNTIGATFADVIDAELTRTDVVLLVILLTSSLILI